MVRIVPDGKTRIVLVSGDRVYKIARMDIVRVLSIPLKLLRWTREERRQRFDEALRMGICRKIARMLFRGLSANRTEYRTFQLTRDARLAPVLRRYCWGLVIVQARGDVLGVDGFQPNQVFPQASSEQLQQADAQKLGNYGRFPDGIKLLDYGNPSVLGLLGYA